MSMCKEILLPVSLRKTQFAITKIMFLGFLVDSKNKLVLVPIDKIHKANVIQEVSEKEKDDHLVTAAVV